MRIGPTSLHLTSVLAKGYHRPKFRQDLRTSRQNIQGEISYVIKVPETESYARYGVLEYDLFLLCDGTRTPAEIAEALAETHPESSVDENDVLQFLDDSDPHLWERTPAERNLALLAKIRDERKSYIGQSSLLYLPVTSWDPDRLLDRLHPYVGWMFTRGFVAASIALFAATAAILGGDFHRIQQDTLDLYNFSTKTAYDLWAFWFLLLLIGGIHEFGHGMACKHFGGEVHHMGFLLIYFTPAFYTDTTDQYLFPRIAHREWVIFAGIWIELVCCGVATLAWHLLPPGNLWSDLAYKTILISGIAGVLVNLNPLMKFDGYYALAQWLQMDNLREDAFAYARAWFERRVLGSGIELPPATRRQRRVYRVFAPAAFLYSAVVLLLVGLFAKNVFVSHFGAWGYAIIAGALYLVFRKSLRQAAPAMRQAAARAKEHLMAWRIMRTAGRAGLLAAVAAIVLVPLPTSVSSNFLLEPIRRTEIRPPAPGVVEQVLVRTGQRVAAGQTLALMANPALEESLVRDQSRLAQIERSLLDAEAAGNQTRIGEAERERKEAESELAQVQGKLAGLRLRSPQAGIVTTPEVEQKTGVYLQAGETFAVVADRAAFRARLLVLDRQLQFVRGGAEVKLKLRALPFDTFSGRVTEVLPAAASERPIDERARPVRYGQDATNYFAVIVELPNPGGRLREGMTGYAKVYASARPLAWQTGRTLWRWMHSLAW
ncbi:MAG TPA: efflux RND transporter periplasmic adaptor subunit [Candidatus Acidoferrales bacterium]|nr:efflux RND transporter periplasmic adaptor subunit [Candidatus Acidoferrales bacterium]